jgi:putative transposase
MRYAAIDTLGERYPLSVLCELLEVSRSGYHERRSRPASARRLVNERLVSEIRVLHAESFGSYGSPRIHAAIKRQGRAIGRELVRRLMHEHQIVGRHRRKRCRTTDSSHAVAVAPNLLRQDFACHTPDTVGLRTSVTCRRMKAFCTSPQ